MQSVASVISIEAGDACPRFHCGDHDPIVLDLDPRNMHGVGKGAIDRRLVAITPIKAAVAVALMHNGRISGKSCLDIDHCRQRFDTNFDLLDCIPSFKFAVGHYHGQDFADMPNLVPGEQRPWWREERTAVAAL